MARYVPMLVERIPNATGGTSPTLNLVDEIIVNDKLTWSTELLTDGGFITFACVPDNQSQDIKDILLDIAEIACEIWLYRDDALVQAGPVIGVQTQGPTLVITCRALAYYLKYMYVTSDLTYDTIDQYTIGKGLVDHWQDKSYGHFGIDTSVIGVSGFTRTIKYIADEAPNIFSKLTQLSENVDGWEWYVDPSSRELVFTARRGSDKSSTVILDNRAIVSPNTHFSVAYGDYVSHAIAIGSTVEGTTPLIGTKTNTSAMQKFGRVGLAVSVDEAETQLVVDNYAENLLGAGDHVHFIPSIGSVIPVLGAGIDDFDVGDTIHWVYDYGLGKFRVNRDVNKRFVNVTKQGEEAMTIELL